jgi:predicted AAA+ superfamily ATPase
MLLTDIPPHLVLKEDLLQPEVEDRYRLEPERLEALIKAKPELEWVFIDEIQKLPRLLDVVHRCIETYGTKFILTGSSARKLKRGGANLLAGRAFVYHIFPFSTLELEDKFDLQRVLAWGSLPKVYLAANDEDRFQYLRAYALTYLKEEVQVEQLVRNLDPFRFFLEIAAQTNGKVLNNSAIAKQVGVDHKTVQSYFQILEDTLLGFILPSFHQSVRKSQLKSPKFYFFDTGVKRALERSLDVELNPRTSAYGEAFEHWVILEAHKLNESLQRDYRMSFFLSKDNVEIDLILSKPGEIILIEIKSSKLVDHDKVKRYSKLAVNFLPTKLYWLSQDTVVQEIEGVRCVDWRTGLAEIFLPTL